MRRRLAIAIAGVAAGAVILFAIPLGASLRQVYHDEDLLRLERDTVAATRGIDISPGGDPVEIPSSSDRRVVYARSGRVLAGRPAPGDLVVAREAMRTGRPAVHGAGHGNLAAVPILSNERVSGALVAQRSGSGASHDTRQAWLLVAAVAAAVLLAAVAAAFLLARGLSRPLERLAAAAQRLGLGDFSVRAPRAGVAEVDAVAEALDATGARLDELVTRERAFSADASHQLRTPLTALRLELEEAELGGVGADPASALAHVDRLEKTIDTLLAVARSEQRGGATTDLTALAEGLEPAWRAQLASEGRRLELALDAGALLAVADEGVVREIVTVLIDNAFRHGAGAVTVSVRRLHPWLRVEVRDEGSGFGDDPESAFERNVTRDGHGIGLALARSLAHAEGGRLSILIAGECPVVGLALRAAPHRDD